MTALQTITAKLHAKADKALKEHINSCTNPLFEECRNIDYPALAQAYPDEWKMKEHWIGNPVMSLNELAFLYLRDKWRDRFVHEFMEKVELAANAIGELQ